MLLYIQLFIYYIILYYIYSDIEIMGRNLRVDYTEATKKKDVNLSNKLAETTPEIDSRRAGKSIPTEININISGEKTQEKYKYYCIIIITFF